MHPLDASLPLPEQITDVTHGRGVNLVITACAVPQVQAVALEVAALNGKILFFGGLPAGKSVVGLDTNLLHYKQLLITGMTRSASPSIRKQSI